MKKGTSSSARPSISGKRTRSPGQTKKHVTTPGVHATTSIATSDPDTTVIDIAERLPAMVFINCEGRIVYANRMCETLMGYSRAELCSDEFNFMCLVAPEHHERTVANLSAHRRGEEVEPFQYQVVTRDGRRLHAVITTKLINFKGRRSILGIVVDITPQMTAQAELAQERDRISRYFDVTQTIVVALNRDGRIEMLSRAGSELLGYTEKELIGKSWFDTCLPPRVRTDMWGVFAHLMTGGYPAEGTVVGVNPVLLRNGEERIVEWHNSVVKDRTGTAVGTISSGLDITDREQSRQLLQASEKRLREFVENNPLGMYRTTPDGWILMANAALVRMLGYGSFEELAARNIEKGSYTDGFARKDFFEAIEATGELHGYECVWTRRDGTRIHVRENSRVVKDDDGTTICYEGTVENITERCRAEEHLAQEARLESLITSIAVRFGNLAPADIDAGLAQTLKQVGDFFGADRSYIFQFTSSRTAATATHEWFRSDLGPMSVARKHVNIEDIPSFAGKLFRGETVSVPRVRDLPEEAGLERSILMEGEVRSILLVPLVSDSVVTGFFGFEALWQQMRWPDGTGRMMTVVAEIMANALRRQREERRTKFRRDLERLVAVISTRFVNLAPTLVDSAIDQSLEELGTLLKVDRCHIYTFSKQHDKLYQTHCWNAPGVEPMASERMTISTDECPWAVKELLKGEPILAGDPSHISTAANFERQKMVKFGVKSALAVPFYVGGEVHGFLGLVCEQTPKRWDEDTAAMIRTVAEMFASAINLKQKSATLEHHDTLTSALMDNIPDSVYFKDRESRFIRVNRRMAEKFGFTGPADLAGKTDADLFSKEHADAAMHDEQEIMRTGVAVINKEERETWPDGRETWVSTTKMPLLGPDGDIIGTFGISRDITDRKRAEDENRRFQAQLQHTQKLESLGVLSGGIAHDFNNLLMGILGNTSLALMELPQESSAWTRIKQAEEVALRAAELTNQMLAYSGKATFSVKPLSLSALVREMAHLLEVSISRQAKLVFDCPDSLPMIDGDPTQIRQVIMNLITNASDAIGSHAGTITMTTGVVDCDVAYLASCYLCENHLPGRRVYVEVTDTGCGMSPRTIERIFDPFYTTKISGRGLGLAAVLGIVRSHAGGIRVYSEEGKGSTFRILFPESSKAGAETAKKQPKTRELRGSGTVAVVDDDEIIRSVAEGMLRKLGFDVVCAGTVSEALECCRQHRRHLSLVLMDVNMPDSDAAATLDAIRKTLGSTPILLISGYNESTATADMPSASYQAFLQKPFSAEALTDALHRTLDR